MTTASLYADGTPKPCARRFNMAAYAVREPATWLADKPALIVVDGDAPEEARETWTFAQIDRAVRKAAAALIAAGLQRGERVLIRLGDGPQFPVAFFGVIAAGGVAMPLSSQLSARELSHIAADATPRFALLSDDAPDFDLAGAQVIAPDALTAAEPADYADTHKDDPAFLVYTSGSSGTPKGVLHAQRSAWARRMMRAGWHGFGPEDRVMHAGAFNWTYTLGVGLSDPWSAGATAILNAGSRAPQAWGPLAKRWEPTVFAAVPGVYRRILKYGTDARANFASLRHALTAGEKLGAQIQADWAAQTGKPLLESLGMSEVSTFISASPTRQADAGWIGWAQPGRRVAVLGEDGTDPLPRGEEGLLAIDRSDDGLMLGYWQNEAEDAAATRGDWFITGDRVVMREDGAIAYAGRNDDLMNAQGYRVSPLEIEETLTRHPSVAEAAVTETPVRDGLTIISAWIVPAEGAAPTAADLTRHCETALAAYKIPKTFHLTDTLPRSANGKLLRRNLPQVEAR